MQHNEVGSLPFGGGAETGDFCRCSCLVCRQLDVYLSWAPGEAARANNSRQAPQVPHPGSQLVHHAGRPKGPQRWQKWFLENHDRGTIGAPGLLQGHCRTITSKNLARDAGPGTSNGLFHGCFPSRKVEGKRPWNMASEVPGPTSLARFLLVMVRQSPFGWSLICCVDLSVVFGGLYSPVNFIAKIIRAPGSVYTKGKN